MLCRCLYHVLNQKKKTEKKIKSEFCFSLGDETVINFTLTLYEHILSLYYKCVCTHMLSLSVDEIGSLFRFLSGFLSCIP